MSFKSITINDYIKKHIASNPDTNEKSVKGALERALNDFKNKVKCSCGNDIWVIGSAFAGNACFTCITGENYPTEDFEIDAAIKKIDNVKGRRHIDDMDPTKIAGFFDDDGYEINPALINKPSICLTCVKDDNPHEVLLCNMNRYDQRDEKKFKCYAYEKRN